jgi:hypothetical protein
VLAEFNVILFFEVIGHVVHFVFEEVGPCVQAVFDPDPFMGLSSSADSSASSNWSAFCSIRSITGRSRASSNALAVAARARGGAKYGCHQQFHMRVSSLLSPHALFHGHSGHVRTCAG